MRQVLKALIFALAATLVACGPSKSDLRKKLMKVDAEMSYISTLARSQQSRMNEADFAAYIGGFAVGCGITSSDGDLAAQGAELVLDAGQQAGDAQINLNQIQLRYNQLAQERMIILDKLE